MSTETEQAAIAWKHVREALANGCSDEEVGHIARTRFAVGAHLTADSAVIVNEQVIELDEDAVALIAATFDADRHPGQIEATDETWAKVRAVFAPSLAPAEDAVGFTRIATSGNPSAGGLGVEASDSGTVQGGFEAAREIADFLAEPGDWNGGDVCDVAATALIKAGLLTKEQCNN